MTTKIVFDASTGQSQEIELSDGELAEYCARIAEYEAGASDRLKGEIGRAADKALDAFARTRGYDSIMSACSYATSSLPKLAVEGKYCTDIRDATWASVEALCSEIDAGTRFEFDAKELPVPEWPE